MNWNKIRRGTRGSVLLHVMVTGALVALIAALLLRMSMLRYTMAARGAKALQEKRYDQAALASILSAWNSVNITCANNVPNYTCAPAAGSTPGSCGCTCTPSLANFPTVNTSGTVAQCQMNIVSTDMQ